MESEDNNATPSPSAADARRRSGRVVRAPRKFTEEVQNDTSSRRKRTRDDNEEDAENQEPNDSLEEASDEEEAGDESEGDLAPRQKKAKPRAKKPAAKKPKINGSAPAEASSSQAPALRLPNRPKKTVRVAIARKDGNGLYGETPTVERHAPWRDYILTIMQLTYLPPVTLQTMSLRIGFSDTRRTTPLRLQTWSTAFSLRPAAIRL